MPPYLDDDADLCAKREVGAIPFVSLICTVGIAGAGGGGMLPLPLSGLSLSLVF